MTELQPAKVPTLLNILGLGVPQAGENLRTSRRENARKEQAATLKPVLSQFGAETGAQLGGMLTSGVPAVEAQGATMLADLQSRKAGQGFADAAPQAPLNRYQEAMLAATRMEDSLTRAAKGESDRNAAELAISKDMRQAFGPLNDVYISVQNTKRLMQTGSALGGAVAVVQLARAADPESVVRDTEAGRVEGGVGLTLSLQNAWNRIINENFTAESVESFTEVVDALLAERSLLGLAMAEGFRGQFTQRGLGEQRFNDALKTSGISLNEIVKAAMPAMTDEQLDALANGR